MKKKVVSLLLAASLVMGMTACGGQGTEKPASAGESTAAGTAGEKQETTVSAFIMQSVTGESGIWQGWGAKKLYDDLKMKINFDPTGNEVETKLQQYLVSGSLPDLIGLKGTDQAQLCMDADMLLPLDEYKDKLPNIFGNELYDDAIRYSQDYTSNGTGKLYIMPVAIGPVGLNSYNWTPLLQWDAYKQAGMPRPETLEDYLDITEAMLEKKPQTDLGEKVYGFSLFSDWDNCSALEISTLSFMYGIDTEYVSPLMETNIMTNETSSLLADDSFYKRALKFYFEANQRGLLDPDSMTQTYDETVSKISAGRVMFSWFSWLTGTYNSVENTNNPDKVDGMGTVVAKDMKLYEAPDQTIGRNWYLALSKDCKDVDAALELLNWLYDPQVQKFLQNGPEDVTWEWKDGEPEIKDWVVVDQNSELLMPEEAGGGAFRDGVYAFNSLGLQASTTIPGEEFTLSYRYWPCKLRHDQDTLMKQEINEMMDATTVGEYLEKNDMIGKSTQAVSMVVEANDDLQLIMTQIGEVVKKFSWQMVYAKDEAEFESLWTTMTQQADGLGIDQVTEFYTQAWADALEKVKDYE